MSHAPVIKTRAVVEITATVRFKIWVDKHMLEETDVAHEYLLLHVNDHPDIQADVEAVDNKQVLDRGPFEEEAAVCDSCGTQYFDTREARHIDEHEVCTGCPIPENEA